MQIYQYNSKNLSIFYMTKNCQLPTLQLLSVCTYIHVLVRMMTTKIRNDAWYFRCWVNLYYLHGCLYVFWVIVRVRKCDCNRFIIQNDGHYQITHVQILGTKSRLSILQTLRLEISVVNLTFLAMFSQIRTFLIISKIWNSENNWYWQIDFSLKLYFLFST